MPATVRAPEETTPPRGASLSPAEEHSAPSHDLPDQENFIIRHIAA